MRKSFEHADEVGQYKIPAHHPVANLRRSRWGIWTGSMFSVAGVVALITLTGTGGATADVPLSLQVGAQAATTTVAPTTPATTMPSTTLPTTTLPSTTVAPTTIAPTTVAPTVPPTTVPSTTAPSTTVVSRPTTTVTTPLSIVVPKSKVSEGGIGGSDDSQRRTGSSSASTDN